MKTRLALLVLGTLAVWVVVVIPARYMAGDAAALASAAAVLLCLVPTVATLAWSSWALNQAPETQLVAVLGGTGVRMFLVLGAGWALSAFVPQFRQTSFWLWLIAFYLLTLGLEMTLLLYGRSASSGSRP